MSKQTLQQRRGAAVVALMLVAVIILGSMLMLHTAAVLSVGNTSRALEVARQNAGTARRLEHVTREAVQSVYGVAVAPNERGLPEEIASVLAAEPAGAVEIEASEVADRPAMPRAFPSLQGAPTPLVDTASALGVFSTPELSTFAGDRSAASNTFTVRYRFGRAAVASAQTYTIAVDCRVLSVPLSRFGLMAYDLPNEIGAASAELGWPTGIPPEAVGPRGLVPNRDPARVGVLDVGQKRPGHYRYAAALSEAYQYVFSRTYLQNAADCAGQTHFVQIGAGPANPTLHGGTETGNSYSLDIAHFGVGELGPRVATKQVAVFYASGSGCTLTLSDSGGETSPMLLVIAGPSDAAVSPLVLQIATSLQRPIVLVCYHVQLDTPAAASVNGALFLDRECTVNAALPVIAVGHLSYWAGGPVSVGAFRLRTMSPLAESLAPRVLYAATINRFL